MNNWGKPPGQYSKWILLSLAFAAGCLGSYVGYITVDRYAVVARAGVSATALYLLFVTYVAPHRTADTNNRPSFVLPGDLKYVVLTFVTAVIGVWAGVQVIQLAWWLIAVIRQ